MLFDNRFIWLLVWLIWDAKVQAFRSGCNGRYFVISDLSNSNEFLDQSNAQQRCLSNGTKLVEITSEDIQNSVINFISRVYTNQILNGLSVLTNGKRSGSDWIRLNGNGIRFLTVYEQPDISLAYGYLRSSTSGFDLFASRPADKKGGFICSGPSFCSGGVTFSDQCYKSFTETMSWYDARNRCLVGGGDLASFNNITTNDGFNALNGSWLNPSNSYWIGIRRESWTWQETNSDVKYSDWLTGHPMKDDGRINSDCLCLSNTEWKWIECGCNQQLPFICILDNTVSSTTSTTTSIPSTSSTTTSIPSISSFIAAEVGLGIGLGVGIPLIIVIAVLAVMVSRWQKKYRQAMQLFLEAYQRTSSKNQIQQSAGVVANELSDVVAEPYESLKPRVEGTSDSVDRLYQSLDHSTTTDV